MARSGEAMRSMGRRLRESSPSSLASRPSPAKRPVISRIVVPEFPQSRASLGRCQPPPHTEPSSTRTPKARRTRAVERTSAASAGPESWTFLRGAEKRRAMGDGFVSGSRSSTLSLWPGTESPCVTLQGLQSSLAMVLRSPLHGRHDADPALPAQLHLRAQGREHHGGQPRSAAGRQPLLRRGARDQQLQTAVSMGVLTRAPLGGLGESAEEGAVELDWGTRSRRSRSPRAIRSSGPGRRSAGPVGGSSPARSASCLAVCALWTETGSPATDSSLLRRRVLTGPCLRSRRRKIWAI